MADLHVAPPRPANGPAASPGGPPLGDLLKQLGRDGRAADERGQPCKLLRRIAQALGPGRSCRAKPAAFDRIVDQGAQRLLAFGRRDVGDAHRGRHVARKAPGHDRDTTPRPPRTRSEP